MVPPPRSEPRPGCPPGQAEKMALEDEDAYLHSPWANPKALKNAFSGIGDIKGYAGQR